MTGEELCRSTWEHLGAQHWCSNPKGHDGAHTCDNETFHDHNGPEMVRRERDYWREQFYEEQATSFTNPAMVSFRHVYIDLRGKSDAQRDAGRSLIADLRREIRDGAATLEGITQRSLDDHEYSAADFGYLLRNDPRNQSLLGRTFVDSVFAREIGDVSEVLESNVALHIVLITDKRTARILGLDDPILPGQNVTVRQQISGLLGAQMEQEALGAAVDELVAELRLEAEMTIFDNNLPW